jgi:hypothetical protein
MRGVHGFAPDRHLEYFAGQDVLKSPVAEPAAHREEPHPARGQESMVHHLLVIGQHFVSAGEIAHPLVQPHLIALPAAELLGRHAVKARRLVQRHERIGVVPVSARLGVLVDDDQLGVGFSQDGVGEGQAHGAAANDQIISLK